MNKFTYGRPRQEEKMDKTNYKQKGANVVLISGVIVSDLRKIFTHYQI